MCDCNVKCYKTHVLKHRKLTLLLLDCWQREYDRRPYRHFKLERLFFEERMKRFYDPIEDFAVIIEFIKSRPLCSIKLQSLEITLQHIELIQNFVESLWKLKRIELKLMTLPTKFFEFLAENVNLMKVKELVLSGSHLNDEDIMCLRSFLIQSTTLQTVNVSACNINQYNFANVADGVHKSQSMVTFNASRLLGQHLSLDSEKIAMVLASLVWQNQLRELTMEMCALKAQDMECIAEYLFNKSSKLEKLNFAQNKIGADGARFLLEAISASGTLKYLNLSGCGLGLHGGEYVVKYLSSCKRLETLLLGFNEINPETISLILLTMKKSFKLNMLGLWGNRYNPRTGGILRRLIESRVLPQDCIDITYTFDDTIPGYRVIPWRP